MKFEIKPQTRFTDRGYVILDNIIITDRDYSANRNNDIIIGRPKDNEVIVINIPTISGKRYTIINDSDADQIFTPSVKIKCEEDTVFDINNSREKGIIPGTTLEIYCLGNTWFF
jgi:hypothetical protein